MPSASTLLEAHRALVKSQAGAGQMGLAAQIKHGPAIKALSALVDGDLDPRRTNVEKDQDSSAGV